MKKGIIEGICAAVFVFACFIGLNLFQMWGVYVIPSYRDEAGFPVTCYSRGGIGVAWLDIKAALVNCYVAFAVATHVALGVLLLLNPLYIRAIVRRIVTWRRRHNP